MSERVALLLVLSLTASLCLILPVQTETASKTIVVPDEYPTIQGAIDSANAGDAILVKSGTYNEQALEINKPLTITSEFPHQARLNFHPPTYLETVGISRHFNITTMHFNDSIHIKANNVKLSGFVITNEPMNYSGIANLHMSGEGYVSANGDQIQITNNIIGTEEMPFTLDIAGNKDQAINNTVATLEITGSNQTVVSNDVWGIVVSGSFNSITKNSAGLLTLAGNNNNVADNSFTSDRGGGYILLTSADHNTFTNNTVICDWNAGISIGYATPYGGSYNVFVGNKVERANGWGILVANGSYNVFYGNQIANNGGLDHDGYGLALGGTNIEVNNNLFFSNIFVNNSKNFGGNWEVIGSNSFDNGATGNYWDDYSTEYPHASEIGFSGVGDTPYLVYGNVTDHYPLMNKPEVSAIIPVLPNPWSTLLTQLPPSTPYADLIPIIFVTMSVVLSLLILIVLIKKPKNGFIKENNPMVKLAATVTLELSTNT